MASALDMPLDSLIKQNRTERRGRGRGRGGRGAAPAAAGRGGNAGASPANRNREVANRSRVNPFKADSGATDLRGNLAVRQFRVRVSNLHYNVSEEELKELFERIGRVIRCKISFDRSGRSLGIADAFFTKRSEAQDAIDALNGRTLDGQTLVVEWYGGQAPPVNAPAATATFASPRGGARGGATAPRGRGAAAPAATSTRGRGAAPRGAPRGARGASRGGRGGRSERPALSVEELDRQLDEWVKGAQ